ADDRTLHPHGTHRAGPGRGRGRALPPPRRARLRRPAPVVGARLPAHRPGGLPPLRARRPRRRHPPVAGRADRRARALRLHRPPPRPRRPPGPAHRAHRPGLAGGRRRALDHRRDRVRLGPGAGAPAARSTDRGPREGRRGAPRGPPL
ncbi:MAG: hypothetical protein AVDCRST_MAG30-1552, partial [uncultured Solirubrobacteraceae bacterium]